MTKEQWYKQVVVLAQSFGYSAQQIMVFRMDIMECYNEELTPEECVEKVF